MCFPILGNHIFFLLQNLQGEIDEEYENFISLTDSSKRTLSRLDTNNEETVVLKNNLEEMNERWNYLKAKSVDIKWVHAGSDQQY